MKKQYFLLLNQGVTIGCPEHAPYLSCPFLFPCSALEKQLYRNKEVAVLENAHKSSHKNSPDPNLVWFGHIQNKFKPFFCADPFYLNILCTFHQLLCSSHCIDAQVHVGYMNVYSSKISRTLGYVQI